MPHLPIVEPAEASGTLAEIYKAMRGRPMPPIYQPVHGGIGVNQSGPLAWPHRELVAATTSRLNQCFY